jgi:pyruvate ferredoxin oxidoreductase gamma subunit/2-oxoisovalerate ferredoxin oxidoreductase gamma subunit
LAFALSTEGKHVQSFAHYGAERRGAPVEAFVRADDNPILLRCLIYEPDCVVVLDPSLVTTADVTRGLKPGGWLVVNSKRTPESFSNLGAMRVATVDADQVALRCGLGTRTSPIVNTAMVGALAQCTGLVKLDSVKAALREVVPADQEANRRAVEEAYRAVRTFSKGNP